jgi:hypothetical protein
MVTLPLELLTVIVTLLHARPPEPVDDEASTENGVQVLLER